MEFVWKLEFGHWDFIKGREEGRGTDVKFYPIVNYPIVNSTSVRKIL